MYVPHNDFHARTHGHGRTYGQVKHNGFRSLVTRIHVGRFSIFVFRPFVGGAGAREGGREGTLMQHNKMFSCLFCGTGKFDRLLYF